MKYMILAASFAVLLFSESLAQGAGFTGIGAEAKVNPAANASRSAAATRANVPTYAMQSHRAKRGRTTSERYLADQAISYHSSGWNKRHAISVKAGEATALLRVVAVDGSSFAVMGKIRQPWLRTRQARLIAKDFQAVMEQQTGCRATGGVYFYGPNPSVAERIAYPVAC